MSQKTITLGYCRTNETLARTIEQHLGRVGYRFRLLFGQPDLTLSEQLEGDGHPLLLLVTDNFLRSSSCIHQLLPVVKTKAAAQDLLVVTADGVQRDDSGELRQVPTAFERVSEIIRYMNHWQDTYLDLRKSKGEGDEPLQESLEAQLAVVRDISAEVGELLRQLRGTHCITLKAFQRDDYARFFTFTNHPEDHERLRRLTRDSEVGQEEVPDYPATDTDLKALIEDNSAALLLENDSPPTEAEAPPVDLGTIPGMSLLNQSPPDPPPTPAGEGGSPSGSWPEAPDPYPANDAAKAFPEAEAAQLDAAPAGDDTSDETDAQAYVAAARSALQAQEIEQALQTYRSGLAAHPDATELRYRYAVALIRHHHDLRGATQQLETLLDYDEENVAAYFLLAEMAELHKDYLTARNYYQRVAKLDPTTPGVYYRLGMLTQLQFPEKQKKAFKYFREAVQQDPTDSDARYQYGLLLWQFRHDHDNALAQLEMVVEAAPDHAFAHYDIARILHERGDLDAARRQYQRAIANNPEVKTRHNDRAFGLDTTEAPAEEDQLAELHEDIERLSQQQHSDAYAPTFNSPEEETEGASPPPPAPIDEEELEEIDDAASEQPARPPAAERPTVLITGATSGIGRATAVQFARAGYRLILTGRREDRLQALRDTFEARTEAAVHTLCFDVSRPFAVQEALNSLPEDWQNIDILINNAGLAAGLGPIHRGELDDWERMIDTNVKGLLYMTRAISPHMVRRRRGHIINVGSVAGKEVYPNGNVYCATKHAVDALTKAMRIDLHAHNIRVSQVAPGHVEETEFAEVRHHGDREKAAQTYEGFQPLRASDVADIIFFMATRPPHVNVQDVLVFGTQQGGATYVDRSGRPTD